MGSILTCCKTCSWPQETDTAPGRRRILTTELVTKDSSTVKITTEYMEKADGTLLFGKLFEPKNPKDAKAMICHCIGFADHTECFNHDIGVEYAQMGFVVFMLDWQGHGRSDGDFIHIQDFDVDIVDQAIWAFEYAIKKHIKSHEIYADTIHKNNNYFLSGTSMGGAIAIKIALKAANDWKGLVTVCPMVAIKEEAKPPRMALWCMINCCLPCCPKAKIIPNTDTPENLTTDAEIRKSIESNPIFYGQPLSLVTGWNLLNVTETIQLERGKLTLPLFICHGDDDNLTDCEMSKVFYESCGCKDNDKMIKIYEGKGHVLYEEEPRVFEDAVAWMLERMARCTSEQTK